MHFVFSYCYRLASYLSTHTKTHTSCHLNIDSKEHVDVDSPSCPTVLPVQPVLLPLAATDNRTSHKYCSYAQREHTATLHSPPVISRSCCAIKPTEEPPLAVKVPTPSQGSESARSRREAWDKVKSTRFHPKRRVGNTFFEFVCFCLSSRWPHC